MNIEEIKKRCEAATEGPWGYVQRQGRHGVMNSKGGSVFLFAHPSSCLPEHHVDEQFIAHARTDIPELIAEVERLEEIETDLNNTIGFMQTGIDDWKAEAGRQKSKVESWKRICNATAEKQVKLRAALQALYDVQNGCPLPKYEKEYKKAISEAEKLLQGDK